MSASAGRLQILDGLRGLGALAVACFHFTNGMPPTWFQRTCDWGWLGVEMFFVITGFVIPYSLARAGYTPNNYARFLLKRAARLHPPFLASVLLVVGLWYLSALSPAFRGLTPNCTIGEVALHATLLNSILHVDWLQPVYWTLAIEFQFYLLIGLGVAPLLASHRSSLILLSVLLLLTLLPADKAWIIPYLPLFVLGIAVFLHERGTLTGKEMGITMLVAVACGLRSLSGPQMLAGVLTSLAICSIQIPMPRPVIWLGSISYSLYLVHVPIGGRVINLAQRYYSLESTASQISVAGVALLVSLVASYGLYRWVECPAQRLSSRLRFYKK